MTRLEDDMLSPNAKACLRKARKPPASDLLSEMAQLLEFVAGKGDKAVWLSNGWREDVNEVLRKWMEPTTCPDCNGEGATAPNGVKYCNCPEVT